MIAKQLNSITTKRNVTIFDLKDENKLQEFFAMRNKDASKCKGCLWPSSYEAEYLKLKESK